MSDTEIQLDSKALALYELALDYLEDQIPIKKRIKALKSKQYDILKEIRTIKNRMIDSPEESWALELLLEEVNQESKEVDKLLRTLVWQQNPQDNKELNIPLARSRLITDYLTFNRQGLAKCLWHQDSHPSLKYHKQRNKVHCFVCNVDKDTIDVIMQLNSWDFKTSVKFLTN